MDEAGRVDRVPGRLFAEVASRNATKLVVEGVHQLISSALVSGLPVEQEFRDVAGVGRHGEGARRVSEIVAKLREVLRGGHFLDAFPHSGMKPLQMGPPRCDHVPFS